MKRLEARHDSDDVEMSGNGIPRGMRKTKTSTQPSKANSKSGMTSSPTSPRKLSEHPPSTSAAAEEWRRSERQLAAALEVCEQTVLHTGSFADLPFCDGVFSLVTASLSIHNADKATRKKAIGEAAGDTWLWWICGYSQGDGLDGCLDGVWECEDYVWSLALSDIEG